MCHLLSYKWCFSYVILVVFFFRKRSHSLIGDYIYGNTITISQSFTIIAGQRIIRILHRPGCKTGLSNPMGSLGWEVPKLNQIKCVVAWNIHVLFCETARSCANNNEYKGFSTCVYNWVSSLWQSVGCSYYWQNWQGIIHVSRVEVHVSLNETREKFTGV